MDPLENVGNPTVEVTSDIIDDNTANEIFGNALAQPEVKPSIIDNSGFDLAALDDYIASKLGSDTISTGDPEDLLEYKISELPLQSKIALLEELSNKEVPSIDLNEDEQVIIDMLRNGEIEDLYNALAQELGKSSDINTNLSDDEVAVWKINSDFPDYTDEEVAAELEALKNSLNYEKKISSFRKTYDEAIESYMESKAREEVEAKAAQWKQRESYLVDYSNQVEEIGGFQLDDEIKSKALNDVVSNTDFHEFIASPEGLYRTAVLWNALPEISAMYEALDNEIRELKKTYIKPKTVIQDTPRKQDVVKNNNESGTITSLEQLFKQ